MKSLKSFRAHPLITKKVFLKELEWHRKQDKFIQKYYGRSVSIRKVEETNPFKGCAVGCSLNSIARILGDPSIPTSNYSKYEEYLGVPIWLAELEEDIFECLPPAEAKNWPLTLTRAIPEGVDLEEKLKPKLLAAFLRDALFCTKTNVFFTWFLKKEIRRLEKGKNPKSLVWFPFSKDSYPPRVQAILGRYPCNPASLYFETKRQIRICETLTRSEKNSSLESLRNRTISILLEKLVDCKP